MEINYQKKDIEIIPSLFFNHNKIKLEINNSKTENSKTMWKLSSILKQWLSQKGNQNNFSQASCAHYHLHSGD
jgi:hypothetical protein